MKAKNCPKCGAAFTCGHDEKSCWCADPRFRVIRKIPETFKDCLCPACLAAYCETQGTPKK